MFFTKPKLLFPGGNASGHETFNKSRREAGLKTRACGAEQSGQIHNTVNRLPRCL
jgi:hypothetical protein